MAQHQHGRTLIPHGQLSFPDELDTDQMESVIMNHIGNGTEEDKARIAFALIHHSRLTPSAFQALRKKFLPSFSTIKWMDIKDYFVNSLDPENDDHRCINTFPLERCRVPLEVFKGLAAELDQSRRVLGTREDLETEAAVQLYLNPIPALLLGLFHGRLTNLPEHHLQGQIAGSGRCEYTISYGGNVILLFIECKNRLATGLVARSNQIAQIMAEADGADTWNESKKRGGVPIHAVLTDGIGYEIFVLDFRTWSIRRGIGNTQSVSAWNLGERLYVSESEKAPDYLSRLKTVVEVLLDVFLRSFILALVGQRDTVSPHGAISSVTNVGSYFVPPGQRNTVFWDQALVKAREAQDTLRGANAARFINPEAAEVQARRGLGLLNESVMSLPRECMDWSLTDNWNQRRLDLLRA